MNNVNVIALNKSRDAIKGNPTFGYKQWKTNIYWLDGLACQLKTRDFEAVISDIGQALGGNDSAPTPIEYLLNSAGSCFATTFQMLASQDSISIHDFSLEVVSDFSAGPFLGLANEYAGIYNTTFNATIKADVSDEIIAELAELALLRSPVVASLKTPPTLILI